MAIKIAIFPASSEIGLEVIRSLTDVKDIELFAVDSVDGVAKFYCNNYINNAPRCGDERIKTFFIHFDYVYPTNELAISDLKDVANAISHPAQTIDICESKLLTYDYFKDIIPVPIIYPNITWSKPDKGHSGHGQYTVTTSNIHCEYLQGDELTIDCFTHNAELVYCEARQRIRVSNGIAIDTRRVDLLPELKDMAHKINTHLNFTGAWFFQVKSNGNIYKLLEIGARIAGSSALNRAEGVNLPLLNIYSKQKKDLEIIRRPKTELLRNLTTRCELPNINTLYVDYDDTLIINGKVNHKVMALVYKLNVETHILTRNKQAVLIEPFKSVIVSEKKYIYSNHDTMLIDDSFRERKNWHHAISPQELDLYI